jgi:hypothetical protein
MCKLIFRSTMLFVALASSLIASEPVKPTAIHESTKSFTETAPQTLDTAPLNRVLLKHLHNGRIDFKALQQDTTARQDLAVFVTAIGDMPESEPLASWINTYNALVVDAVLQRYPIGGVGDVPDFFSKIMYRVAGKERSLDDIENGVMRPRFKDARIHMALNCGAVSCPNLPKMAFEQGSLDEQLEALTIEVINDGHHVALQDGQLEISALFSWFEDDFVSEAGSVVGWIKRYATSETLKSLPDDIPLKEQPYDWALAAAHAQNGH